MPEFRWGIISIDEQEPDNITHTMTTQEHHTVAAASNTRHFKIFWNDDGQHVSRLTYTEDQIDDINEIVETVLRGMGASKGLGLEVELVP